MGKTKTHYLKFTASRGKVTRTLKFPITKEIEDYVWKLDELYGNGNGESFEVEGNRNIKIRLSIVDYEKDF